MTDRVALVLALVLAVAIAGDFAVTGGEALIYLARKFLGLMDWLVFWN